jgi:hypothetical protein
MLNRSKDTTPKLEKDVQNAVMNKENPASVDRTLEDKNDLLK